MSSNIPAIKDAVKGVVKPASVEPGSTGAWNRLRRHLSGENVYGSPIDMRQVNYDAMMRSPAINPGSSIPMEIPSNTGIPLTLPEKKIKPPTQDELQDLEVYLNSRTGGALSNQELQRLLDEYDAP
jgi:hypothetical protein